MAPYHLAILQQKHFGPKGHHNQFIMLIFLRHGFTAKQLKILNLRRMWTRAISLTYITTGDGRFIQPQCLTLAYRRPTAGGNWPKTGKPDVHCWQQ
jgi:hypothetical protein